MHSLVIAALLFSALASPQQQDLKRPESKMDEHRKYHVPLVQGHPAELRLKAYEQRQRMEADSDWSQVRWRSVGPEIQGGRVLDIEVAPGDPKRMFVAFATG